MSADTLIVKNGTLIDGTGREAVTNAVVRISGNRISSVTAGPPAACPQDEHGVQVIDAAGKFVMPGLIDGHCHLSLHQGAVKGVRFPASAEFCTMWAARGATLALRAGVTSISVPGGKWFVDVTVRDSINGGLIEGPRVFAGGRALTPYGGIFDSEASWRGDLDDISGVLCNTVNDYVTEVRRQSKHGVDLIKVADSYWGDVQAISEEEVRAVVDEAHRRNVRVAIHSRGSGSTSAAARAGVDWIFHADFATDKDLDEVAEAGIPIMPAFTAAFLAVQNPDWLGMDDATHDRMKRQLDINLTAISNARDKGIPILVGTDTGNAAAFGHGKWHGHEPEILVKELGFTPMEAIESSTRLNAQVVGLEGELGTIEPGKLADLVIYDDNPLTDIGVLKDPARLSAVIKDGVEVDRTGPLGFRDLETEPGRAR
ncbi:amidohydrolase family protein [Streptomyces sp. SDT5-1]|uniref:amidohydrolase family protein n=1 Tax=Streptomyces sp. SDT5-1 TaxID=3406418 RepID=UPI003FD62021